MEDLVKGVSVLMILMITLFVASVIGGTILWGCYDGLLAMFPSAVSNGVLTKELEWWDAVKVAWACNVLIKAYNTNNKKSD